MSESRISKMIPRGNKSKVLARIIEILKSDKYLSKLISADKWFVSDGKPFDPSKMGDVAAIYINARPYGVDFYGPDSQSGILQLEIYLWLPGSNNGEYNVFDVLDVWDVVEMAFYPVGNDGDETRKKQAGLRKTLQDCGAKTGIVKFSQPFTPNQTQNFGQVSYGQLQIDVTRRLSP